MEFKFKEPEKFKKPEFVAELPLDHSSGKVVRVTKGQPGEGAKIEEVAGRGTVQKGYDYRIVLGGGLSHAEELIENLEERQHYGKRAAAREPKSKEWWTEQLHNQREQRRNSRRGRLLFGVPDPALWRK